MKMNWHKQNQAAALKTKLEVIDRQMIKRDHVNRSFPYCGHSAD